MDRDNVLRALIFNNQVSLTLADTTEIVAEGIARHTLASTSAVVFGKAISAMTFASACLKMETGEISLSVQTEECGDIGISGNQKLFMRGYIENTSLQCGTDLTAEERVFGCGSLTIIRDDGYNRPFVGSCAIPEKGGVDAAFEEYYKISEQLPTYLKTVVEFNDDGTLAFAGVAVLQPLPFADEDTLKKTKNVDLKELLSLVRLQGLAGAFSRFDGDRYATNTKKAVYRCNCSRERLLGVLASVGEEQLRTIIREDGQVSVHCHYCNSDYIFTEEDADKLFAK